MKLLKILFVSCAAALYTGCAPAISESGSQSLLPEIDLIKLKDDCDEALRLGQDARMDVQVVNTKLAEIDHRVTGMSEDFSSVSQAKIEDMENRIVMLTEAVKELQRQAGGQGGAQKAKKGQAAAAKEPETPTFSPTGAAAMVAGDETELYQTAVKAFNDKAYNQAYKLFESLITQYPQGAYVNNAWYWMGEVQFALGQYAKAISAFNKVLASGQSPKSDDSQLKIGMCYAKLGRKSQARESFTILINQYPNSEYVSRARKFIEELK